MDIKTSTPNNAGGHICILQNSKSGPGGNGGKVEKLIELLRSDGCAVVHESLVSVEQTKTLIADNIKNGCRLFVVAGGDGTVRSISQCLYDKNIPVFIFPMGTENLLAREIGISNDPQKAFEAIKNNQIRKIDIVHVNDEIFLAVAGVGIDSQVVNILHNNRKGNIKKSDYIWPTIKTFLTYKFPKIKVTADDEVVCDEPAVLFFGNISRYGGGFKLFETSVCNDSKLDMVIFKCRNIFQLIYLFVLTLLNRFDKSKLTSRHQCSSIKIESTAKLNCQLDGDCGPDLPLEILVNSKKLPLVKPMILT